MPVQDPESQKLSLALLARHAHAWLDTILAVQGCSVATFESYGRDVSDFLAWVADLKGGDIPSLVEEDVVLYLSHCALENLAPRTRARRLSALRSFFAYLAEEGVVSDDPTRSSHNPRIDHPLPSFLTQPEMAAVLSIPDRSTPVGMRDACILELLYAAGLRVSELCRMTLSDVDLIQGTVRAFGKGARERRVPIHERMRELLDDWMRSWRPRLQPHSDVLFPGRTGEGLTRQRVWNIVRKAAVAAGITRPIHPHTFRHSFATHLLEGGADLRSVQALLGHADVAATEIYTHVQAQRLKEIHRKLHPRSRS